MCFGASGEANSTLVINSTDPAATPSSKAAEYGLPDPKAKPGNLDLTDEKLQAARKAAKLRAAMGYGRSSTFLTGAAGDTSAMKLSVPTLLGSE
jgi:hypothetical protein